MCSLRNRNLQRLGETFTPAVDVAWRTTQEQFATVAMEFRFEPSFACRVEHRQIFIEARQARVDIRQRLSLREHQKVERREASNALLAEERGARSRKPHALVIVTMLEARPSVKQIDPGLPDRRLERRRQGLHVGDHLVGARQVVADGIEREAMAHHQSNRRKMFRRQRVGDRLVRKA